MQKNFYVTPTSSTPVLPKLLGKGLFTYPKASQEVIDNANLKRIDHYRLALPFGQRDEGLASTLTELLGKAKNKETFKQLIAALRKASSLNLEQFYLLQGLTMSFTHLTKTVVHTANPEHAKFAAYEYLFQQIEWLYPEPSDSNPSKNPAFSDIVSRYLAKDISFSELIVELWQFPRTNLEEFNFLTYLTFNPLITYYQECVEKRFFSHSPTVAGYIALTIYRSLEEGKDPDNFLEQIMLYADNFDPKAIKDHIQEIEETRISRQQESKARYPYRKELSIRELDQRAKQRLAEPIKTILALRLRQFFEFMRTQCKEGNEIDNIAYRSRGYICKFFDESNSRYGNLYQASFTAFSFYRDIEHHLQTALKTCLHQRKESIIANSYDLSKVSELFFLIYDYIQSHDRKPWLPAFILRCIKFFDMQQAFFNAKEENLERKEIIDACIRYRDILNEFLIQQKTQILSLESDTIKKKWLTIENAYFSWQQKRLEERKNMLAQRKESLAAIQEKFSHHNPDQQKRHPS